jgi:hypothetical protein
MRHSSVRASIGGHGVDVRQVESRRYFGGNQAAIRPTIAA